MNVITLLLSATSQGMLWSLLAIGVYMTFRILDIADLTAEEAFLWAAGSRRLASLMVYIQSSRLC